MTSSLAFTILFFFLSLTSTLVQCQLFDVPIGHRKDYIVFMGDKPKDYDEWAISSLHINILRQVVISDEPPAAHILRSYNKTFSGFVARLTENEAQQMAELDEVVSVFPNRLNQLQTTTSWDFIGFPQNVPRRSLESDIIIGVLDTGIWPESISFDDRGFGPKPAKWKGTCQTSSDFKGCNNKIIGAMYSYTGTQIQDLSVRDTNGHGTHVASIASGILVSGANLYNLGKGTSRGGVPSARIAVYKVCWSNGCSDADILAAYEQAIVDGVDIISTSIAANYPRNYFESTIAIGSFYATRANILCSVAAGNDGPDPSTVRNFAPWIISVAASTTVRQFKTNVVLGNSLLTFQGFSINTFDTFSGTLIYGGDAPNTAGGFDSSSSRMCLANSLNPSLVSGKIVLCDGYTTVSQSQFGAVSTAFNAGAYGVIVQGILRSYGDEVNVMVAPIPSVYVVDNNNRILAYIKSTWNPVATIYKSIEERNVQAPYVARFSSRGPSPFTPSVLKPDLAAPGVDILAAYSPVKPLSGLSGDNRFAAFNFLSGTSMACPHVSGAAAYIKSFHPTWSPAAIRSALMTTATPMNANLNPDAEFAYGAGQINPVKALTPGLVYDASENDYIKFLCGNGYSDTLVQVITGTPNACTSGGASSELNYPAFVASVQASQPFGRQFSRRVTNVGSPTSTYRASWTAPTGLTISVSPNVLSFTSLGQTAYYSVTVQGTIVGNPPVVSASLVWYDVNNNFQVKSPIVVYVP